MMRQMIIFNCNTDFILGCTAYGCMLCWLVVVDLMSRTTDWKHTTGLYNFTIYKFKKKLGRSRCNWM